MFNLADLPTFCISLNKYLDKWPEIEQKFTSVGFKNVHRMPGIIGDASRASLWNQYRLIQKTPREHLEEFNTLGAIGCFLAHMSVWKRIVDENISVAMVTEDDVSFPSDFKAKLDAINIPGFQQGDAIAFTSKNMYACPQKSVSPNVVQLIGPLDGAHCYVLTQQAARLLYECASASAIEIHVDAFIGMYGVVHPDTFRLFQIDIGVGHLDLNRSVTDITHTLISRHSMIVATSCAVFLLFLVVYLFVYLRKQQNLCKKNLRSQKLS